MPPSADAALDLALSTALEAAPGDGAARLAVSLGRAFGPATLALLHYGSHAHGAAPTAESAFDFFVIVEDYGAAYRSLVAAGALARSPRLAALLNRVLPPNVIAVGGGEGGPGAKCAVLSLADLRAGCSARARDHFTRARLFQPLHWALVRDEAARRAVAGALREARLATFEWARPFLPASFDTEDYCRTLFEISYGAELRPEDPGHIERLLVAQGPMLLPGYGALLRRLAADGRLQAEGDRWHDPRRPGAPARGVARVFFGWSKVRATLRWLKYIALYDGWLDYVLRKVERRSGMRLELTDRERRWPLIFLWPKALRYLAGRRRKD